MGQGGHLQQVFISRAHDLGMTLRLRNFFTSTSVVNSLFLHNEIMSNRVMIQPKSTEFIFLIFTTFYR